MIKTAIFLLWAFSGLISVKAQYQYIEEVLEYTPAPGQFINTSPWGMPASAESIVGTISGSLSLGAWGGYVVFRFAEAVQNHPDHPFGIDFIIFGNPTATWSEPASVWVMQDENGNGLPDGTWYQLAGSDYFFSSTQHNYQVTYFNPHSEDAEDIPWEDNYGNEGSLPANSAHNHNYYPAHSLFPHIPDSHYTLSGSRIAGAMDKSNPAFIKSYPRAFGYADNTPRKTAPFNVPDNPYSAEIENAGGDGFDISWAVDNDGNYVDLEEIHFIKVQTAMLDHGGWLGEVSAEITGAVMTEPNSDITGNMDVIVVKDLPPVINQTPYPLEAFAFYQGRWQPDKKILWDSDMVEAYVDEEGWLHFEESGEITLTAYREDNPDIFTTITSVLEYSPAYTGDFDKESFSVYPNPASGYIHITTKRATQFILYDLTGRKLKEYSHEGGTEQMKLQHLRPGVYLLMDTHNSGSFQRKIIIR